MNRIYTNGQTGRIEIDSAGKPADKSYLEYGLPNWLQESVQAMQAAWDRVNSGEEYYHWDIHYCELQSDINVAEVEGIISSDQAWYLREKYLGLDRI